MDIIQEKYIINFFSNYMPHYIRDGLIKSKLFLQSKLMCFMLLERNIHWSMFVLWFYEQRKYVNKTEKRRTHGVQQNNSVYLIDKDIGLLTRKRSCFNSLSQIHIHVCHGRFQVSLCCPSCVSILLVSTIPQCTVHGRQLPFYPLGGITDIFFVMCDL